MKKQFVHKLAIRHDDAAGLLRAYFSSMDDTDRLEVATISLVLVRKTPGLFEDWKTALAKAHRTFVEEATGLTMDGQCEIRLRDMN